MRKGILILSSIFILVVLTSFILWWRYGVFSEYRYFAAKRDIKNGNIRLLGYGLPVISPKDNELDKVRTKYGFKTFNLGCTFSDEERRATNAYNRVMDDYLAKRNGKNWRTNYEREIDSIYKIAFHTLYRMALKVPN